MTEVDYPSYETSEVNLREAIGVLRRRRWSVLVIVLLFLGLGMFVTVRMTPVYQARSTMLIEQSPMRVSMQEPGPLSDLLAPAQPHSIDTQVEVLDSGPLRSRVIKRLSPIPASASPVLTVAQVRETDVIQILAESTSPRVAQAAANTLVDEYIRQSEENNVVAIRRTRKFTESKLTEAQKRLASIEGRLKRFQEQNRISELDTDRENAIKEANGIGEEERQNSNDLAKLRSQIQKLRIAISQEPAQVRQAETIVRNPNLDAIEANIQNLQLRKITLLRTLKPNQPEVREVETQIQQLRGKLRTLPETVPSGATWQPNPQLATLRGQLVAAQTQARGLESQLGRLDQQYQQARQRLEVFPAWDIRLAQLARERNRAQDDQKALGEQVRDLRLREQAQGISARFLTRARLPSSPVRPRPVLNLLVAAALGLIAGIGFAALREMTDDRIHTSEDADRILTLPVLGRIPVLPGHAGSLVSGQETSVAAESFRRLRLQVRSAAQSHQIRSLLVTSATAGEGKSTTAANLAAVIARQGQRVILVDADLRSPSLASMVGIDSPIGLCEVLQGKAQLSEALYSTEIPDLLFVPAGAEVPNPGDLLAGSHTAGVIQQLVGMADLVVLDTPPCLPVADAEVLGAHVDGALLVVGLGQTYKPAVLLAQELLGQARVPLFGVVMNRVEPDDRGYYRRSSRLVAASAYPAAREGGNALNLSAVPAGRAEEGLPLVESSGQEDNRS